ncbi:MAG: epimerase, partial [Cyanobium sp. RS427]|nr:epimerase [Cyanobium sp. RS427]
MQPPASEQILVQGSDFADWTSLNDTIMGGRSRAGCRLTPEGLVLEGELIE